MNKVAAVTGAASGIGEAATRRLLKAGWTVYGLDLQAEAAGGDGGRAFRLPRPFPPDHLRRRRQFLGRRRLRRPRLRPERADLLRRRAAHRTDGGHADRGFRPGDEHQHARHVPVRATGAAVAAGPASPDNPSRVVLLSSLAALRPKVVSGAYAASKAAVSQLCRVMAAEWAPSGVLVNALAPGTVDTPMVRAVADPQQGLPAVGRLSARPHRAAG